MYVKSLLQLFLFTIMTQWLIACSVNSAVINSKDLNQEFFFKTDFYLVELFHFGAHHVYAVNTNTNCCLTKNVALPKIQKYYRNPMIWKNWQSYFLMRYRIIGLITEGTRCRVIHITQKNNRKMYTLIITTGPFKHRKILLIAN